MKNYYNTSPSFIVLIFLIISFVGCNPNTNKNRTLVDSNSGQKKILNLSPPFFSMLLLVPEDEISIIGVNPRTFNTANKDVLDIIYPAYHKIETSMVDNDFNINIESLLQLAPNQIFYYGEFQNKGVEKTSIHSCNVFLDQTDPKVLTIEWEKILTQELNFEYLGKMETQWDTSDKVSSRIRKCIPSESRGLFIFSNINGKVIVAGNNSYGDHYLRKANIKNVAQNFNGEYEVDVEQIYKWDPDCIFIFLGNSAKTILAGSSNQNLSSLKAVKEKRIYDIPRGVYAWGSPCSESPLTPMWMMAKTYPEFYSIIQFRVYMKLFYQELYDKDIDINIINSIIDSE